MLLGNMFSVNNILETALQASVIKADVISNNIANADVPGFKKKTVTFESYLSDALDKAGQTGKLNLSKLSPTIRTEHENFSYRLDGNNVDIEQEMLYAYQNSVRYDFLANSVINNYRRLNAVLTAFK